jgi:hypothetical protein
MRKVIAKLILYKYAAKDVEWVDLSGQCEMTNSCESSNEFWVP